MGGGAERINSFRSSSSPAGGPFARAHIGDEVHFAIGADRFDRRPRQGTDVAHEGVLAKDGFHALEFDAGTPNLDLPVLAADPLQQPIGPLAYEISRPEKSTRGRCAVAFTAGDAASIDPKSQRHV